MFLTDDFKPASIDHSKQASLEVKEGSEVNISFPNDEVCITFYTFFWFLQNSDSKAQPP